MRRNGKNNWVGGIVAAVAIFLIIVVASQFFFDGNENVIMITFISIGVGLVVLGIVLSIIQNVRRQKKTSNTPGDIFGQQAASHSEFLCDHIQREKITEQLGIDNIVFDVIEEYRKNLAKDFKYIYTVQGYINGYSADNYDTINKVYIEVVSRLGSRWNPPASGEVLHSMCISILSEKIIEYFVSEYDENIIGGDYIAPGDALDHFEKKLIGGRAAGDDVLYLFYYMYSERAEDIEIIEFAKSFLDICEIAQHYILLEKRPSANVKSHETAKSADTFGEIGYGREGASVQNSVVVPAAIEPIAAPKIVDAQIITTVPATQEIFAKVQSVEAELPNFDYMATYDFEAYLNKRYTSLGYTVSTDCPSGVSFSITKDGVISFVKAKIATLKVGSIDIREAERLIAANDNIAKFYFICTGGFTEQPKNPKLILINREEICNIGVE